MIRDEELCRQLQQGSEAALEALVHRHHRALYAYLFRLSGSPHTAEDLAQETFTRLLTRIDSYRFPQPFTAWLYTIAHNLYKDHCKAGEQRLAQPVAEPLREQPGTVDISERIAERSEVVQALRTLEPAQREVLLLRFYQDLKVEQIAAVTGVPAGTVKSRLFGAVKRLRLLLIDSASPEGRETREATGRRHRP